MMLNQEYLEPRVQRRKVLLVAVEPSVESLISTFLASLGWTCAAIEDLQKVAGVLLRESFEAVVMDLGRSGDQAERAIREIERVSPGLNGRILIISSHIARRAMKDLIERHNLVLLPPKGLLGRLWAVLEERVIAPSAPLATAVMPVAELIFDSFRYAPPTGVRGFLAGERRLAYQHLSAIIDLSLEWEKGSERMSLTGQVLHQAKDHKDKKDKLDQLSVLLVNSDCTLARTVTNGLGEFQIDGDFQEDLSLEIRLGKGAWVSVPLGKADWSLKRAFS